MNVGDYVRTKEYGIHKISIIKDDYIIDDMLYNYCEIHKSNVIKSSPNIIDLIEVGDYVNKKRVEWIGYKMYQDNGKECKGIGNKIILFNEFTKDCISEKGIKSIVTKEQFSQMEYKVGD